LLAVYAFPSFVEVSGGMMALHGRANLHGRIGSELFQALLRAFH
jgi:hypothetical protein